MKAKEPQSLEVEYLPIDQIVKYRNNAKQHPKKQIRQIEESIEEFGFNDPIAVWTNKDGEPEVVEGHGRLIAARNLGYTTIPVVFLDRLSDAQRRAYTHVHNQLTMNSEWDDQILALDLVELANADIDMHKYGFDDVIKELGEKTEDEKEKQKRFKAMELKSFEHHDYVVFVFDEMHDWLRVCQRFGLGKVDAGYGDTRKIGLGRVLHGSELVGALWPEDSDSEQG